MRCGTRPAFESATCQSRRKRCWSEIPTPAVRERATWACLRGAEIDQLTHGSSRFERGEAFVNFGQFNLARDQMIELQASLSPQGQQSRHVDPEAVAAH